MDMTAVFTAAPQFTVLAGRQDSAATVLAEPVRFVSSG
jgi:hypothetical protein